MWPTPVNLLRIHTRSQSFVVVVVVVCLRFESLIPNQDIVRERRCTENKKFITKLYTYKICSIPLAA